MSRGPRSAGCERCCEKRAGVFLIGTCVHARERAYWVTGVRVFRFVKSCSTPGQGFLAAGNTGCHSVWLEGQLCGCGRGGAGFEEAGWRGQGTPEIKERCQPALMMRSCRGLVTWDSGPGLSLRG